MFSCSSDINRVYMAEGFRTYQRSSSIIRPIIPTPYSMSALPGMVELQSQSMLNHYYDSYLRLVRDQNILNNQLKIINKQKLELSQRFENMKSEQEKKKRRRRTADEINRDHDCPIRSCGKSYGSDGSLLQHIKLKHFEFYQSEEYEHLLLDKQKKKALEGQDHSESQT